MPRIESSRRLFRGIAHLALLGLVLLAPLVAPAQTLRIATYNLYNYLSMDRSVDGQWRKDYPKPETEKSAIRRAILEVKPDLLAIQEIGNPAYLSELRKDLRADGLDYPHTAHLQGPDPDRCLAVLSRLPLHEVTRHTDLDFKYFDDRETVRRGLLEVEIRPRPGLSLQIFNLHLKSRWTLRKDDPEAALQRTREAEACRNRIIQRTLEQRRSHYLILGDFNDHPDSAALRRFQKRGKIEIAKRLPATDSRGELWTHFYRKAASYSTVDGILAAPKLMPAVQAAGVVDLLQPPEGSDHRLVYADFDFSRVAR
ncbi:MAG: endonuclease/exonuclease/phosphatase family protein [Opitutales bacterium]